MEPLFFFVSQDASPWSGDSIPSLDGWIFAMTIIRCVIFGSRREPSMIRLTGCRCHRLQRLPHDPAPTSLHRRALARRRPGDGRGALVWMGRHSVRRGFCGSSGGRWVAKDSPLLAGGDLMSTERLICDLCGKRMRKPGLIPLREHKKDRHLVTPQKPNEQPEDWHADYDFPCGY